MTTTPLPRPSIITPVTAWPSGRITGCSPLAREGSHESRDPHSVYRTKLFQNDSRSASQTRHPPLRLPERASVIMIQVGSDKQTTRYQFPQPPPQTTVYVHIQSQTRPHISVHRSVSQESSNQPERVGQDRGSTHAQRIRQGRHHTPCKLPRDENTAPLD